MPEAVHRAFRISLLLEPTDRLHQALSEVVSQLVSTYPSSYPEFETKHPLHPTSQHSSKGLKLIWQNN
jgi:hypothetical protein